MVNLLTNIIVTLRAAGPAALLVAWRARRRLGRNRATDLPERLEQYWYRN